MLAEVTEAINFLDIELVERNFLQCRQYAVIVLGPLHNFGSDEHRKKQQMTSIP